jgi:hypothetical protein
VLEDELQGVRVHLEVQRDRDRAGLQRAEVRLWELAGVRNVDPDAVVRLNPVVEAEVRDAAGPRLQFLEGGLLAHERDRRLLPVAVGGHRRKVAHVLELLAVVVLHVRDPHRDCGY